LSTNKKVVLAVWW